MAITWGSKKNGVRIGVEVDPMPSVGPGTTSVAVDVDVYIDRDVNISDSSNNLEWSGGVVTDGSDANINVSGSGVKKIKTLNGQSQTLDYGSTKKASVSVSFSGINYAGGTLTVSKTVTYPARPFNLPNTATSLTATRVSDTQQRLAWARTITSDAPWSTVYVERRDNVLTRWSLWRVNLAGQSALSTGYTDATTQMDRKYEYRIRAQNTSGYSDWCYSAPIYTTPVAPTGLAATKVGTTANINLLWTNESTVDDGYEVSRSDNGGAWASMGVFAGVDVNSYLHTGASTTETHKYRVRLRAGTLFSDWSNESNTVQLLTNPNPPTNLANGSSTAWDATGAIPFSWQHNSVDTTAQTKREVQYRISTDNGATWGAWTSNGQVTTEDQFFTMPANTFANNRLIEWQVRTWGQYASPSNWSASRTLATSIRPTVAITAPAGATVPTSTLTLGWTYGDAEGTAQSAFRVRLVRNDTNAEVGDWTVNSAANTYVVPVLLSNLTSYTATVWVKDGSGLWSNPASVTFTVDFPAPNKATLVLDWDPDRGAIIVTAVNPPVVDPTPEAISNNLYWAPSEAGPWERVASIPVNGSFSEAVPATGVRNYYKVITHSALPSSIESDVFFIDPDPEVVSWVWFNTGPGFSVIARARLEPSLSEKYSRTRVVHYFDGNEYGTEYNGDKREHKFTFKAQAEIDWLYSTEADFRRLNDTPGPACYRDPWYRWYVSIGEVGVERTTTPILRGVTVPFERVGYDGG